jgi:RHS repeat-associated protein
VTRGIDPPEVEGYQWDGWKLIMIAKLNTDGTYHSRRWSCVWRPDIGSSLYARSDWMRAGGVGGVAWLQTGAVQSYSYGTGSGEVHVPLADHMGNVRHYYQFKASGKTVTGQLVASYEYDAFGREVRAWGTNTPVTNQPPGLPANRPWADLLPFHYSSKLRDVDSGFNYYGYRFYDPGAGRWLNRDPIGERGGTNLYGMCYNDPLKWLDVLGRDPATDILDKMDPKRDKTDDAAKRGMMDSHGCIGGAAAGCGHTKPDLSKTSSCYGTQKEAEAAAKKEKCACDKPARIWALRYKDARVDPTKRPDKDDGATFPATAKGPGLPQAAPGGSFDSRFINGGRAQGVNPTGPNENGKIPWEPVDDSIDDWRKKTAGYTKEQWCVTCPEK